VIISGPTDDKSELYKQVDAIVGAGRAEIMSSTRAEIGDPDEDGTER